jgi:NTE family protein
MSGAARIGVALGSGAARGLAHIPYIEAMDELGLRPARIAGSSMGALIGAGWANGMTGAQLREHAYSVLGSFTVIAGRLWSSNPFSLGGGLNVRVDPRAVVGAFLPDGFPDDFAALATPFSIVATDMRAWSQTVFESGSLHAAIAASVAIPSMFRPMAIGDRLYMDGGVSNPLPLDLATTGMDLLIGIDINGIPDTRLVTEEPNPFDSGIIATQIVAATVINQLMRQHRPDIYVRPEINGFGILEFWRVREIIAHVETDKDNFKRALSARLEAFEAGRLVSRL